METYTTFLFALDNHDSDNKHLAGSQVIPNGGLLNSRHLNIKPFGCLNYLVYPMTLNCLQHTSNGVKYLQTVKWLNVHGHWTAAL